MVDRLHINRYIPQKQNAVGRELLTTRLSILNYPAGTYFVTLRTPDTASTQRLVIE